MFRLPASLVALIPWTAPLWLLIPGNSAMQPPVTPKSALSEPALSPDSKEIVFVAGGDLWTVAATGGIARLLVAHPATESRPLWSPDGTRVAFVSTRTGGGDIYVLDLATGALARRTFSDGREQLDSWSRDGAWLYFSSSSGDISGMNDEWRVSANGGQPTIVAGDRYATEYWGAPSPDGKTLAITARGTVSGQWWRHGHSHLDESEIWLVKGLDAATPTYELFGEAGGAKDAWPMWSPDGKTLYYMSDRSGEENLWAKAVSTDLPTTNSGRKLTSFTNGRVLWPQMAYDGSAIVFERNYGIWRYDVAKGNASEVSITLRGAAADVAAERQTLAQGFGGLAVSPDTRKAAFVARGDVYVVGTRDGGEATRLTATPDLETEPSWFPDSRRVVYAAMRGTAWNLYVRDAVTKVERALTTGPARSYGARVSPDGKLVAYQRDGHELRVIAADGTGDHRVAEIDADEPPLSSATALAWSPDSRWIAYASIDAAHWTNIFVVALDGTAPHKVSFGAEANVGGVQWSPDGKFLLYRTSQRTETPRLMRVDLVQRTPRFREDQYRDLFGPVPMTPPTTPPATPPSTPPATAPRDTTARPAAPVKTPVTIDFTNIRLRASILPTQGLDVGALVISPDSKTLAFTAVAGGQQQIYTLTLDELARDQQLRTLTTSTGGKNSLQFSPDSRELWYLEGGRINAINVETRVARSVAASAEVDVSFESEKRAVFDQARSYLANNFFDATMHGVDWNALGARVAPYAEGARNPDDLRRVMSLMIGELNGSHLGINGPTTGGVSVPMARFGVRFDRAALENTNRYRVAEVIALSPAAIAGVAVGDFLAIVDGVPLTRAVVLDSVLLGKVGRKLTVSVINAAGSARELSLSTITLGTEKALRYRQWVEQQRAYVAQISNGRLGYVHMADMSESSLDQLNLDLDAENRSRDGVVVDVRNNNGGFVNAYAIDILSRRSYLQFTERGSITAPARGSLGQRTLEKPTVLVINQHTLSDGEDFTEGYRASGLGKVVGEPTAGWIVFTWDTQLLDGSSLRLPRARVTDAQGRDMELRPRAADIPVVRPVGESYAGRDRQLETAVKTLVEALPKKN